jgi:hypothetical protein
MHVALDNSELLLAVADCVLTQAEAFELEALAESDDGTVPEHLLDAVERLFLYCCATDQTKH